MLRVSIAVAAAFLTFGFAADAQQPEPPALELTGRVVDAAEIISAPVEAEITTKLASLETDTGVQLVVETTPSLDGREINEYSLDLARAWGIGSAGRDDGLLLLVAPNERKVRIDVGYGLEASVRDEEAAAILNTVVLPAFRTGDYESGISGGVDSLIREVTPIQLEPNQTKEAA